MDPLFISMDPAANAKSSFDVQRPTHWNADHM